MFNGKVLFCIIDIYRCKGMTVQNITLASPSILYFQVSTFTLYVLQLLSIFYIATCNLLLLTLNNF